MKKLYDLDEKNRGVGLIMHLDTDDLRNIEDELYYKYELLKFAIKNKRYGDIVEVSQDITKLAYILNIKDNFP